MTDQGETDGDEVKIEAAVGTRKFATAAA